MIENQLIKANFNEQMARKQEQEYYDYLNSLRSDYPDFEKCDNEKLTNYLFDNIPKWNTMVSLSVRQSFSIEKTHKELVIMCKETFLSCFKSLS